MIYLIYKTDFQRSHASKKLIGTATKKPFAIQLCINQAIQDGEPLNEDQDFNINKYLQTQGHTGDYELLIEPTEVNRLF